MISSSTLPDPFPFPIRWVSASLRLKADLFQRSSRHPWGGMSSLAETPKTASIQPSRPAVVHHKPAAGDKIYAWIGGTEAQNFPSPHYRADDVSELGGDPASYTRWQRRLKGRSGRIHPHAQHGRHISPLIRLRKIAFDYAKVSPPIPVNPQKCQEVLSSIIELIDAQENAYYLNQWLHMVVNQGVFPDNGLSKDSTATLLLKRMAELNFAYARDRCRELILMELSPRGVTQHFRLAAAGVLLDHYVEREVNAEDATWADELFDKIYRWHQATRSLSPSLLATGLALCFISTTNTLPSGEALDRKMEMCFHIFPNEDTKKFFLQFLADSLVSFECQDLPSRHLLKLLTIGKHFTAESLVWPNNRLFTILKELQKLAFPRQ